MERAVIFEFLTMQYKNNPLNIRSTSSKWLGKIGSRNGFCEFVDIPHGIRCGLYLITRTYKKRGWLSIDDIIYHWAPPSDGNDTAHYLWFVTRRCGLRGDDHFVNLPLIQQYDVINQMCIIETGYRLSYDEFCAALRLL